MMDLTPFNSRVDTAELHDFESLKVIIIITGKSNTELAQKEGGQEREGKDMLDLGTFLFKNGVKAPNMRTSK